MTRAALLAIVLASVVARADAPSDPAPPVPSPETVEAHLARARDLHDRGAFARARDELLAAYELAPRPELLFALGQIEFNLHHYAAAIDYYERFNASDPGAEQGALAQQAIGAARIELARPPPAPPTRPPPPPHRHWDREDTGLVAFGALGAAAGGGLLLAMRHLANDHSGTLHAYDQRIDRAQSMRLGAAGCFAAGALAIGAALVRWRLHLVDSVVEIHANPGGAGVTFEWRR